MGTMAAVVLTVILVVYIFWPQRVLLRGQAKTRLDYLEERKASVYDNLRDLRFEFQAGKYPEEDYNGQRAALEAEADGILREMDGLEAAGGRRTAGRETAGR